MNKENLIKRIAKDNGMTLKDARVALDAVTNAIVSGLKEEGKVSLMGFGVFSTVEKEAHEARNPKTQEIVKVEAKRVPKFKYSDVVKEIVK